MESISLSNKLPLGISYRKVYNHTGLHYLTKDSVSFSSLSKQRNSIRIQGGMKNLSFGNSVDDLSNKTLQSDDEKLLQDKKSELLQRLVDVSGCENLFSVSDMDNVLHLKSENFDKTIEVLKKVRNYYSPEEYKKNIKAIGKGRLIFSPEKIEQSLECAKELKIRLYPDFWRDFRNFNTLPKYCKHNRYSEAKYLGVLGKPVGKNLKKALDKNIDKMNTRDDFLIFEFAKNTVDSDEFLKILQEKPNLVKIAALWQDNKEFFSDDYESLEHERYQFLSKEKDYTDEEVKFVKSIYNSEEADGVSESDKQKLSEIKSCLTPKSLEPEWSLCLLSNLSQYGYLNEKFFDLNYQTRDIIDLAVRNKNPDIVKKLLDSNISGVNFDFLYGLSFHSEGVSHACKRLNILQKLLQLYSGENLCEKYMLKSVASFDKTAEFLILGKKENLRKKSLKLGVEHSFGCEDVKYLKEIEQNDYKLLNLSFENIRECLPLLVEYSHSQLSGRYELGTIAHCLKCNYPPECISDLIELKNKFSPKERKILMFFSKFNRENLENLTIFDLYRLKNIAIKLYNAKSKDINDTAVGKNIEKQGGMTKILENIVEKKIRGSEPLLSKSDGAQGAFFYALSHNQLNQVFHKFDAKQYRDGVPLKYPRQEFYKDVQSVISNIPPSDLKIIRGAYNFAFDLSVGIIKPCNKIPDYFTDKQKKYCEELNAIIYKFIFNNKVNLPENPQMQKFLNTILEYIPEFTSIIGKKQHNTHSYSVDVHTLKVLQSCLENPLYKTLSVKERVILNIAVLLHDFGKTEGIVDEGHSKYSVVCANEILKKFKLNDEIKNLIITLVENHHWLGELNTEKIDAKSVAVAFRAPCAYKLAKILAQADLKGVSDDFYKLHIGALRGKQVSLVDETLDSIYSSATPLFTSKIIKRADIPRIDGVKVIDVKNNPKILPQIFGKEVKSIDDLRFLVHMLKEPSEETFAQLSYLSQARNDCALSTSYISSNNDGCYAKFKYGVFVDSLLSDLLVSSRNNLNSGGKKGKKYLVDSLTDFESYELHKRKENAQHVMKLLGATEKEYAEIIKQIAETKKKSQIQDVVTEEKLFKSGDIKNAIDAFEKIILRSGDFHNEVVVYHPKVSGLFAKVDSFNEIPSEMKTYAKKYNLPIMIWGK